MATNFNEMFGVEPREDKIMTDMSEGFQAGVLYAVDLQKTIHESFAHKSREYREGMLEGLRDTL